MFDGNDYRTLDIMFPIIEPYINRAAEFHNNVNKTSAHSIYSDIGSKVVPQNHCRERSKTKLEK